MLTTSARLLRLLSLFQARRYWSGADLSGRLEVTARTLRRDVDRLRTLGYPVQSTSGIAGGYQLGAGATLPPLLLDDDEAVAVVLGLRTAAGGTVQGMEEASVRALAKLEQVLPSRLRRRVTALHSFVLPLDRAATPVDPKVLTTIAGACRDHESLRFLYRGRDREPESREVEPHRLVHTGRRWYLVAWDSRRKDWRTFRVDRIESKLSAGLRFEPRNPPDGDYAKYVQRSLSYSHYTNQANVILHLPAETAAERIPPAAGVIEAIGEQRCMLRCRYHSLDMIAIHLAFIDADFEVQSPPELIEHIRALAKRFGKAARHNGGSATEAQ